MLSYQRHQLDNGLTVLVHENEHIPSAVVNILYDVGGRDEQPSHTGFAHLFEHLMFEGSQHVDNFDQEMEKAGGRNNAFTSKDITNYYDIIPPQNIETVFWLESDRLLSLNFNETTLNTQKKVVCEEFKERYLNQPYGDVDLHLRPLVYKKHPYRWPTIGKNLKHIQQTKLSQIKDFFFSYYRPNNAILCVAGNVKADDIFSLTEKWFGDIPSGDVPQRQLPQEPTQENSRQTTVKAPVPYPAIYKAYRMSERRSDEYYAVDLISDLLANGHSSRLYQRLVKSKELFSRIDAYITGNTDEGLFLIEGDLHASTSFAEADKAIEEEVARLAEEGPTDNELEKVKNKVESRKQRGIVSLPAKAFYLSYFENLGDADLLGEEISHYQAIAAKHIKEVTTDQLSPHRSNTLYYQSTNKE